MGNNTIHCLAARANLHCDFNHSHHTFPTPRRWKMSGCFYNLHFREAWVRKYFLTFPQNKHWIDVITFYIFLIIKASIPYLAHYLSDNACQHAKFKVLMAVQSVVDSIAASLMLNEAGLQHCVVAAWDKYSSTATRGPGDNLMLIPAPGQTAGLGAPLSSRRWIDWGFQDNKDDLKTKNFKNILL